MSMCKLFGYVGNFIFFFMLNVHANGAQLQNNYDNQILSSIYSEYNNDYLTWKTLPRYDKFIEKKSYLLNQIIIEEYGNINNITSGKNFTLDLLKSLEQIKKNKCTTLDSKSTYYIFEEILKNSFNFWSSYCQDKVDKSLLVSNDERFMNISFINNLYLQFKEDNLNEIEKLHKIITNDTLLLSQFNSKQLNLINNIFQSKNLQFSLDDLLGLNNSLNSLTIKLDENFLVSDYTDLINMQIYQTSLYYFYAKEYKNSLALLSYLIKNDVKNKDYYLYKKTSFEAELNPNEKMLKLINDLNFQDNNNFQFFKDYLFLKTAIEFDYNIKELINYYQKIISKNEWQSIELAMIVAIELYSQNKNIKALEFIDNCCLKIIENSTDPIHLFKYGILLERNDKIKDSEEIIQKSIDISEGNYPYILNYLAYLWVDNNRNLELAEKMLLQAVEDSNYEDGAILDSLGWLYFKKNEIELAEKWILQAYKMEPSEPEIIDHLSQIYSKQERTKEAKFLDNKILLFHKDYFKFNDIVKRN